MTKTPAVLDSSATVGWIFGEKGAHVVDELLPTAVMAAANFAEVTDVALRRGYTVPPEQLVRRLTALGLGMEATTAEDSVRAGQLIHESRRDRHLYDGRRTLALGDALCIALAERLGRPLVTADTLWKDMQDRFRVPVHLFR